MSALAVAPVAVAEAVRDTLDLFLADHPAVDEAEIVVGETDGLSPDFTLTIDGVVLRVAVIETLHA